jgi:hypothetical protein
MLPIPSFAEISVRLGMILVRWTAAAGAGGCTKRRVWDRMSREDRIWDAAHGMEMDPEVTTAALGAEGVLLEVVESAGWAVALVLVDAVVSVCPDLNMYSLEVFQSFNCIRGLQSLSNLHSCFPHEWYSCQFGRSGRHG